MGDIVKKFFLLIFVALLIITLFLFGLYYYISSGLEATEGTKEVYIQIPSGVTNKEIAKILEENNLVRNSDLFTYYIKFMHENVNFMAGEYYFNEGMNLEDIVHKLSTGDVIKVETFNFTIPEGYTVKQIANKLSKEGHVDEEKFLLLADSREFDYWFINEIPDNENNKYLLEGFLFPDTYEVRMGSSEKEIIETMLRQFDKIFKDEWKQELESRNQSLYDLVILASLVEREAMVDEERSMVAGVLYNRLNQSPPWKLQIDATIQFLFEEQKEVVLFSDLEIDSPYNTYLYEGLPPSPIANPGEKSLEATIYPAVHDYFFYVTKKDGTNEHYFSKTLEEHNRYDAQSRK